MLPNPLRRVAMLIGAFSLLALAGPVSSASALVETSQITSPSSPTYALYDETAPQSITVSGTTNIGGNIALRCYYGPGPKEYSTYVKEVTPSGGAFSTTVELKELLAGPCVLRAVPASDNEAHPPGTASEESTDPFKGPRIVGSRFRVSTASSVNYDYVLEPNSLSSYLDIRSVGACGLTYSNLYRPETLAESEGLFDCNAALYKEDDPPSGSSTRSELQVDGANAYGPATAQYLQEKLKVTIPGAPQVTVTKSFDLNTGLVTIHETDPIVKCSPETVFPPSTTTCKEFVSTGVQLERAWQTSNANQVAWMTDTWRSTNGAAHELNALYDQETVNAEKIGGAYQFPGTASFAAITKGQMISLPSGTGAIYYKEDAETPNAGDGKHPQGAIVYDTPSNGISVYRSTEAKEEFNGFEMPYQHTIPAGGTYTLRMAFVQAYALSEVETLAKAALASYPPSLTIGSPANGSTVSTPNVTVSGTATDTGALASLTVAGKAVSIGTGGAWSTSVALSKGANTITAVATDQAGLSAQQAVSVTYNPPTPHATQVGSAKGNNGEVTFTLLCKGEAGTSCEIESTLTTTEKIRHNHVVAVSARHHHRRTRSERVTVGSSKLTIPAGQKVTISIQLNSTGKSLLAQFGQLPVHLSVVQVSAGHRSTVIAQNLVVTPHHKRHHHRHGHHHHH